MAHPCGFPAAKDNTELVCGFSIKLSADEGKRFSWLGRRGMRNFIYILRRRCHENPQQDTPQHLAIEGGHVFEYSCNESWELESGTFDETGLVVAAACVDTIVLAAVAKHACHHHPGWNI